MTSSSLSSTMSSPNPSPRPSPDKGKGPLRNQNTESGNIIRRSWHAMSDILSPFSPSAIASLPNTQRPARYTRADAIPETEQDDEGQRPTIRDYHAINSLPSQVRIPKKIATPVKVEGKVWFANERSAYLFLFLYVVMVYLVPCSMGRLAEYSSSHWNSFRCAFQCLKRRSCTQLRICLCSYQRRCTCKANSYICAHDPDRFLPFVTQNRYTDIFYINAALQ